ncbi:MAG: hypothetical protein ABI383_06270 [Acidobacteriaceae bacterium]
MISGIHVEVLLAAVYAVFLAGVSFILEALARRSHKRSQRYRNFGFTYQEKMDQWECPAGALLTRQDTDLERRVIRYGAQAHTCNACNLKQHCTDSNQGRILESRADSWVESELRRFHRGISLALLLLATVILVAESVRHTKRLELVVICCLLTPIMIVAAKLFASFIAQRQSSSKGNTL